MHKRLAPLRTRSGQAGVHADCLLQDINEENEKNAAEIWDILSRELSKRRDETSTLQRGKIGRLQERITAGGLTEPQNQTQTR